MHKKALFLSGILVVFVFFGFVPPALAIQRFVNKNFESSRIGPYGWIFWDGNTGKPDYTMALDTAVKRSGRSVKIQIGSDPGPYGHVASVYQKNQSTDYAGKSVKLSAWCKTANGGKAYLKMSITHANGVRDTWWTPGVGQPPTECLSWKQISTPLATIPNDVVLLELEGIATGKNGTVWFDDFNLETNPALPAIIPDQRFGYGGNLQMAKDLNIPWFYNWGVDTSTSGKKTFFDIAHMGYSSIPVATLDTLKAQGLKDAEDEDLYIRLNTVLGKFEGKNLTDGRGYTGYGGTCSDSPPPPAPTPVPKPCKIDGIRKKFLDIGISIGQQYPGAYYQIGNEPDWYPYFTPGDYAEFYNIYYKRIKKYDPSAHVMIGGLISIVDFIYTNPQYLSYDLNNHYKWLDDFRNSYKSKFGSFPKIDVWSIHPYGGLDWEASTKKSIVDFRDIYLNRIGETNKPVWITEFSLLAVEGDLIGKHCSTHGCLSAEEQNQEWNLVANDYMKPLINWMKSNNYVQKWFWYYAGQSSTFFPDGLDLVGDTYLLPNGEYPPMGIMYKQLAEEGAEKIPNCSITSGPSTITLGDTATYNASFSSQQGNLGAHLSVGRNGTVIGNYLGETFSFRTATAATGSFSWTPTQTGVYDVFCRAWNDGITECRGNPAYIDNLPRYECAGPKAYMTVKVISTPASTPASSLPGDLNSDTHVNNVDKTILVTNFNKAGVVGGWIPADIDKNKVVDIFDYNILVENFGN